MVGVLEDEITTEAEEEITLGLLNLSAKYVGSMVMKLSNAIIGIIRIMLVPPPTLVIILATTISVLVKVVVQGMLKPFLPHLRMYMILPGILILVPLTISLMTARTW